MVEEIEAKLTGIKVEAKRTVFEFENPDGGEYPLKISAFQPHVPDLKIGTGYRFQVEHVPMKDGGGYYHNLVRKGGVRNAEYDIFEAAGKAVKAAPAGEFPLVPTPEGQPRAPQAAQVALNREDYWQARENREKAEKPVITRLSCVSSASMAVGSAVQGGAMKLSKAEDSEMELFRLIKGLALRLEGFANEARKEVV